MKTLLKSVLTIVLTCCSPNAPTSNKGITTKKEDMETTEIINVAFFYLKDGQHNAFEKLRSRGNVLLEKYGARIERVIKPTLVVHGTLELPDEIHFAVYPNAQALEAFNRDPEFIELKKEVVAPSVKKMYGFVTEKSTFKFTREIGDLSKIYAIALVYIKNEQKQQRQFAEYHDEVCGIIPEFGTHFERFLVPFRVKGDIEKPSEIHRFYFDSQKGMQQMMVDDRMQKLFPKRDESLSDLIFLIGEAIQ